MKSLYESILDVDDNIKDQTLKKEQDIKEWIKANYKIRAIGRHPYGRNGEVDFEINNGVVNAPELSFAPDRRMASLTNGLFKFGEVGRFNCTNCVNLKTLSGCPEKVKYDFECNNCRSLKNLNGGPKQVGGTFECSECTGLTDLIGAPASVGDDFICVACKNMKSLKGLSQTIGGDLDVSQTPGATDNKYINSSKISGKIKK